MTDVNRSFDEVFAEIAEVRRRLDELPADAFAQRVDLRRRLDELQVEIDSHGHDWDQDRSTEDLLAELRAQRSRLGQLESQKMNVAAQQGGGTQAAGGGDGWGAVQISLAADTAQGVGDVQARIGRIKAILADRGIEDSQPVSVDAKVVARRAVRLVLVFLAVLAVAAAGWWLFVRPAPVKFPASPSAMSWIRVADADFARARIDDVIEFGSDLVAVGGSNLEVGPTQISGTSAVWVSRDGTDWERIADGVAFVGGGGRLFSIARYGSGLITVGMNEVNPVWSSTDGRNWAPVEYHEAPSAGVARQYMVSAASFGSGVVIGGGERTGGDLDAAVWFSPDIATTLSRVPRSEAVFGGEGDQMINDVAEVDGGIVAVGSDTRPEGAEDAAVWFSSDGTTWNRIETDAFGGSRDQHMSAVTSFSRGVVAVGSEETGADLDAAVWFSPDGASWIKVEDAAGVFGGEGHQVMLGVAAYGRGVVAVGYETPVEGDATPVVWYSPDGSTWMRSPAGQAGLDGAGAIMFTVVAQGSRLIAGGSSTHGGLTDASVWIGTSK